MATKTRPSRPKKTTRTTKTTKARPVLAEPPVDHRHAVVPEAPDAGAQDPRYLEAPESRDREGRNAEAPDAGDGRSAYIEGEFTHGRSQS